MAMRRSHRSAAVAIVLLVAALVTSSGTARAVTFQTGDENHVISLLNGTRVGRGLHALVTNTVLRGMAERQAERMAAEGHIFHNPNLGPEATKLGLHWTHLGENVGMGWNVDVVEDALLASPHHLENIVGNYDNIGVGVVKTNDRVFVAQVFALLGAVVPKVSLPTAPPVTARPVPVIVAPKPTIAPTPVPTPVLPTPDPDALTHGIVSQQPLPLEEAAVSAAPAARPSRIVGVGRFFGRLWDAVWPG